MRGSLILIALKRDKKLWIICMLAFYIFYYILSPKPCIETWSVNSVIEADDSSQYNQYKFAVLILTAPMSYSRRNSIRNSWMKLATNIESDTETWGRAKPIIKILFVVGSGGLRRLNKQSLESEHRMHNDMLILDDFIDSYKALTRKMLLSLKWMSKKMKKLEYLIKCDDDSFLRIDLIVNNLEAYAPVMDGREIREFVSHQVNI